jgi:hypothetical protein
MGMASTGGVSVGVWVRVLSRDLMTIPWFGRFVVSVVTVYHLGWDVVVEES